MVDFRAVGVGRRGGDRRPTEIGYPVALKSFDESLRHRLDQSGVRLGPDTTPSRSHAAYEDLSAIAGPWLYVQARCRGTGAEVPTVFRISADPSFGALVSFGIGGVATELLDDRAYRAVPLTDADAADLIAAPRAGAAAAMGTAVPGVVARAPLVDLALRLSALADDLPEVARAAAAAGAGRAGGHRCDRGHGADRPAAGPRGHPPSTSATLSGRQPGTPTGTVKDRVHPAARPGPSGTRRLLRRRLTAGSSAVFGRPYQLA